MKKVLSLLIALVTAFGVSTAAFAATDDVMVVDYADNTGTSAAAGRVFYGMTEGEIALTTNELLLIDDNNRIVGPETHLQPGEEYTFKIFKSDITIATINPADARGSVTPVTQGMLGGGKFRLRAVKGTSTISSAKVERRGGGSSNATYNLVVNTKENWGTKMTDVEYDLSITGTDTTAAAALEMGNLTFKVGYQQFEDDEISGYGEGDIISISNDMPVILKKQFTTLAKNYNYKNIEFEAEGGDWRYIGKVSGMADTNFTYSHDVIPSIVQKFEDQDFKFLTFGAGVNFPTNGEMRIDVSDVSDHFDRMYTYLYRNGKLTPISTTYDTGADEIVFRTNFLGSFVMTNEEITDTTIIDLHPDRPVEVVPPTPAPPANENPGTGTSHGVELAVAMGTVAIAAAAVVSRKRK